MSLTVSLDDEKKVFIIKGSNMNALNRTEYNCRQKTFICTYYRPVESKSVRNLDYLFLTMKTTSKNPSPVF